jgi:hypothetical protein
MLNSLFAAVIFEQSVGMSHDTALLMSSLNGCAYFLSVRAYAYVQCGRDER